MSLNQHDEIFKTINDVIRKGELIFHLYQESFFKETDSKDS